MSAPHQTLVMVASGTVKPSNGVLKGLHLSAGTTAATVIAKNTATGVTIGYSNAVANTTAPEQNFDAEFDTSLYISLSGTGAVATVEYQ